MFTKYYNITKYILPSAFDKLIKTTTNSITLKIVFNKNTIFIFFKFKNVDV